jgi:hypothetical protein
VWWFRVLLRAYSTPTPATGYLSLDYVSINTSTVTTPSLHTHLCTYAGSMLRWFITNVRKNKDKGPTVCKYQMSRLDQTQRPPLSSIVPMATTAELGAWFRDTVICSEESRFDPSRRHTATCFERFFFFFSFFFFYGPRRWQDIAARQPSTLRQGDNFIYFIFCPDDTTNGLCSLSGSFPLSTFDPIKQVQKLRTCSSC